jgi:hypothetical protein
LSAAYLGALTVNAENSAIIIGKNFVIGQNIFVFCFCWITLIICARILWPVRFETYYTNLTGLSGTNSSHFSNPVLLLQGCQDGRGHRRVEHHQSRNLLDFVWSTNLFASFCLTRVRVCIIFKYPARALASICCHVYNSQSTVIFVY